MKVKMFFEMRKKDFKNKEQDWWKPSLVLFIRLSGWVALPVVLALFFGRYLDNKFNIGPWGLLFCVGAAFLLTSVGIVVEASKAINQISDSKDETQNIKHN